MDRDKGIELNEKSSAVTRSAETEVDRQAFHLKTLYDISKDIFGSVDIEAILKNFLLMTTGNFGVIEGFIVTQNVHTKEITHFVSVGCSDDERTVLSQGSSQILKDWNKEEVALEGHKLEGFGILPQTIAYVLPFSVDGACSGLLGLGSKIVREPYSNDDKDLLETLVNNLIVSLTNAKSFQDIKRLNLDLQEKNLQLEKALHDLDQHVYHLKTLYDVSKDIFGSVDFKTISKNFLLMTMGNFGATEGFVLILDVPSTEITHFESMGYQESALKTLQEAAQNVLLHSYGGPSENGAILKNPHDLPQNVACALSFAVDSECSGLLALGSKLVGEPYSEDDKELLVTLANNLVISLKNAKSYRQLEQAYEDLKLLDKAKERVINHLSHELQTPLALISGVLSRISRKLGEAHVSGLEKTIKRGQRNVDRLLDLQAKIDDILNQKSVEEKEKILTLIEDAASFVEELKEEEQNQNRELLNHISKRIESLYNIEEIDMEHILLSSFLNDVCNEAITAMEGRDVRIIRNFEKENTFLTMDKTILKKVLLGLLKNAIENTPDEGKIEVTTTAKDSEVRIDIHDYGVGITPQNQKMIFGGFFHTQDTDMYSSKKPYAFNAGGSGSDLLRIKSFSERYGFSVDFNSTRCTFIPKDTDICPGMISSCPFIKDKSECFSSGESTFSVTFPVENITCEYTEE